jgi:hypothetical protein
LNCIPHFFFAGSGQSGTKPEKDCTALGRKINHFLQWFDEMFSLLDHKARRSITSLFLYGLPGCEQACPILTASAPIVDLA